MGVSEWLVPSGPPFTGRLSAVFLYAYTQFGPHGIAYFWWAAATLLLCYSVLLWRSRETIEPHETANR